MNNETTKQQTHQKQPQRAPRQTAMTALDDHTTLIPTKDYARYRYFAVESTLSVAELLERHPDWTYEHPVRALPDHYVFSQPLSSTLQRRSLPLDPLPNHIASLQDLTPQRDHIVKRAPVPIIDSSMEPIVQAQKQLHISDPSFPKQWHLINAAFPGNDVNVKQLWYENVTGTGIVAAIVDDGVDYDNDNIKDNFSREGSWDFNDNGPLPKPKLKDDYHGTRCAGEIAASKNNGICGVGVAYDAKVAGIRILSGELTAEDEAASLVHALDVNDIYSCSWGPRDDGTHLQGPTDLVKKAMIRGVTEGRDQKGALYVFASGNGGAYGDNCNYDGYTNSIYSITVGAIDHKGLHPPYSESCSAVMVVTCSSGSGEFIHTTDIGDKCSNTHGGTSAAAPLAAGVYTLVLQANPELTWRDIQYVSILSSKQINQSDGDWQMGALGKPYSHKYGYGKMDAYDMVTMARDWENVKPQSWFYSSEESVLKSTKISEDILESTIKIDEDQLKKANLQRVEHVTVTVNIDTQIRGPTIIDLISPEGRISNLGVVRKRDVSSDGFKDWTFMSVAHWGETGIGEWKLQVRTTQDDNEIKFNNWKLKFFGESIDPEKTIPFKFGNDKPDATPIQDISSPVSSTSSISSSSIPPSVTVDPTTILEIPSATGTIDPDLDHNTPNRLPSPTEAFHYVISVFIIGVIFLILYFLFFVKSRRRIRRTRAEAYEFDIIDSDSDYDSTFDGSLASNHATNDTAVNMDDFDFDLSDEDNLSSDHGSGQDDPHIDGLLHDMQVNPFQETEQDNNADEPDLMGATPPPPETTEDTTK